MNPSATLAYIFDIGELSTTSIMRYQKRDVPKMVFADDGALGSYGIEAGVMDTFVRSCGKSRVVELSGLEGLHSQLDIPS